MVAPVDPSAAAARLLALMQSTLDKQRRSVAGGSRRGESAFGPKNAGTTSGSTLELLGSRLRAIGRDHADRRRAYVRVLIQTLLTEEFGSTVVNDAAFQAVVEDVASSIEADRGMDRDIDQVIDHWLGARPE